jgi:CxxC motif-containing protein
MVSVKTSTDIPKGKIMDCIAALKGVTIKAPVSIGDVILHNAADTGVDILATKNVAAAVRI